MPSPKQKLPRLAAAELQNKIDLAILTIREDEERAVLSRFSPAAVCDEIPCSIAYLQVVSGYHAVAVTRCLRQGTNEAQKVTETLIRQLAPRWIVAVGIAGAVHDREFTLGDVVLANHVYDVTVTAAKEGGEEEYSLTGGEVHELVKRLLGGLEARRAELRGWNRKQRIKAPRPVIDVAAAEFSADAATAEEIRKALHACFREQPRPPLFTIRPIVSSNQLVKDTAKVKVWRKFMRHFAAMEMEFAGVYKAAQGRAEGGGDWPVLTVRGISDIVGLKREGIGDWTEYSRNTAAAFMKQLVEIGMFGEAQPGPVPHAPLRGGQRSRRKAETAVTAGVRNVDVGDAPAWDEGASSSREFVGRGDLLDSFRDALRGVQVAHRGRAPNSRFAGVRLFWVHGFGGMGKSWLLRRFAADARSMSNGPRVGLIDWDLPEWHRPAATPPSQPADIFNAIAHRVAQLYGTEKLRPYWLAASEVEAEAFVHARRLLLLDLQDDLTSLACLGPDWRSQMAISVNARESNPHAELLQNLPRRLGLLEGLLRRRRDWPEDAAAHKRRMRELLNQLPFERDGGDLAADWIREARPGAPASVISPARFLAERLATCLKAACQHQPLLLILDTCELLFRQTDTLDEWLRALSRPLFGHAMPFLMVVGSRFGPDHKLPPGARLGWMNEIDARRREVISLEDKPFTIDDIEERLRLAGHDRPVPHGPDFAGLFLRVTLGLPLAVGILLDLHRKGNDVLLDLASLAGGATAESLDREEAVKAVYAGVSSRMLLHLQDRPDCAEDLRDVIALGLLRRARSDLLADFWAADSARPRLAQLARQYEFLASGDLHQRVRECLRRHWRNEPPEGVTPIAAALLAGLDRLRPDGQPNDERCTDWALERLNLLGWLRGEESYPDFVRVLVVLMAHDADRGGLIVLAGEIQPKSELGKERYRHMERLDWLFWSIEADTLRWLRREQNTTWSPYEAACLDLVAAMSLHDQEKWAEARAAFEAAFDAFGTSLPRRAEAARNYFDCIKNLGNSAGDGARRALDYARRLALDPSPAWDEGYYWTIHNAAEYDNAERYCREVLADAPRNCAARAFLSHILHVHNTPPRSAEAEMVIRAGLTADPHDATLNYFLADIIDDSQDRTSEAADLYGKALQLVDPSDRPRVLKSLARCLCRVPQRLSEAVQMYQQAIDLAPDDPEILNSAAWNLYWSRADLPRAEAHARRAIQLACDNLHIIQTFAAVLVRRGKLDEARPLIRNWITRETTGSLKRQWHDFALLFQDVVKSRQINLLVPPLSSKGETEWAALAAASEVAAGSADQIAGPPEFAHLVARLAEQLRADDAPEGWPSGE